MTSCHHGDVQCQNNLTQAMRVIKCYNEIKVIEIDFVQVGDDFVSSHDYKPESISNGSPLREWIDHVVLDSKKILWIDIKSHIDALAFTCCDVRFKFDCRQLFRVLAKICNETKQRLQNRVWLSCQDSEVRDTLLMYNNKLKLQHRWIVLTDIPFVYSYVCKYLLPFSAYEWIHNHVFSYFVAYDFGEAPVICIDQSFFPNDAKIVSFLEHSLILPGTTIILYTFERGHPPIEALGYNIIMQYDYTPILRRRPKTRQSPTNKAHSVYFYLSEYSAKKIVNGFLTTSQAPDLHGLYTFISKTGPIMIARVGFCRVTMFMDSGSIMSSMP